MKNKQRILLLILVLICISCQPAVESQSESAQEFTLESTMESALESTLNPVGTATPEITATVQPSATPEPTQATINPLTGLEVDDPEILERRPVLVKVSNYPQYGRPHAGLSFADIVFEYYIGEGQNRFIALFYGQDSTQIGPVRSGRFVDAQLVLSYSGILAYGSADEDTDEEIVAKLGRYAISNLEAPEPVFVGTDTHSVVGVFANSAALSQFVTEQGLSNKKPDLHGMVFSESVPNHGKYADQLIVMFNYYNRGEWRYDASSGKYLRWIEYFENGSDQTYDMIPLVDRVTDEQLGFSNVIIIFADHTELAPTRYLIDIDGNDDGKKAYFFRDGQMFEGTWLSDNDSDPIQFFNDAGEPMELKPGNTWVVIASMNSTFEEEESAVWKMFFLP